ncbi:MAG: von Willebrand factor type A domain-containing protein, partial [Lentisphaerae bacterium]|nr:von Willebrand factor type A domain-containing protein [Lentisphaerota bacterium]
MTPLCKEIEPLLTRHLLKDLEAQVEARVREHVAGCSRCQATLRDMEPTLQLLRSALTARTDAPERLDAERRMRVLAASTREARRFQIPWRRLGELAAVFVVLLFLAGLIIPSFMRARTNSQLGLDLGINDPSPSTEQSELVYAEGGPPTTMMDYWQQKSSPFSWITGSRDEEKEQISGSFEDDKSAQVADDKTKPGDMAKLERGQSYGQVASYEPRPRTPSKSAPADKAAGSFKADAPSSDTVGEGAGSGAMSQGFIAGGVVEAPPPPAAPMQVASAPKAAKIESPLKATVSSARESRTDEVRSKSEEVQRKIHESARKDIQDQAVNMGKMARAPEAPKLPPEVAPETSVVEPPPLARLTKSASFQKSWGVTGSGKSDEADIRGVVDELKRDRIPEKIEADEKRVRGGTAREITQAELDTIWNAPGVPFRDAPSEPTGGDKDIAEQPKAPAWVPVETPVVLAKSATESREKAKPERVQNQGKAAPAGASAPFGDTVGEVAGAGAGAMQVASAPPPPPGTMSVGETAIPYELALAEKGFSGQGRKSEEAGKAGTDVKTVSGVVEMKEGEVTVGQYPVKPAEAQIQKSESQKAEVAGIPLVGDIQKQKEDIARKSNVTADYAARGKAGNEGSELKAQDGRSTVGRQGKADSEIAADSGIITFSGGNIETRMIRETWPEGHARARATGGGKTAGDELGLAGTGERRDLQVRKSLEKSLQASKAGEVAQAKEGGDKRRELNDKLNQIKIPEINFRSANIEDVVKFLSQASAANDANSAPNDKGVDIVLNLRLPGTPTGEASAPVSKAQEDIFAADPAAPANAEAAVPGASRVPEITLNLRNITMGDALKYVTEVTSLKYRIEDDGRVVITPADVVFGELVTRIYSVKPSISDIIAKQAEGEAKSGESGREGAVQRSDVQKFFESAGVSFPQGTTVVYKPRIGKLIASNTAENLEKFEDILAKMDVASGQGEQVVFNDDTSEVVQAIEMSVERKKLIEKLNQIRIPELNFRSANIVDVVKFLSQASIANDSNSAPNEKGLSIDLDMRRPGQPDDKASRVPEITLNLRNLTLIDALKYVTEVTNLKYRLTENGKVVIMPADVPAEEIITKTFSLPSSLIEDFKLKHADSSGLQKFFRDAGVPFPQGISIVYKPDSGQLIVSNTKENLEKFERILAKLTAAPRQEEPVLKPKFKPAAFNPFVEASANPFSTFSIDVDTASYTLCRNYMLNGKLPPPEAARTEEFVNFFDYAYPAPARRTFAVQAECAPTPFGRGTQWLRLGVKGRHLGREENRASALTLLIDTSGSMSTPDRMGLLKQALRLLVDKLGPNDRVAVVQYDSHARLVLEHTPVSEKAKILEAIERLDTTGSTNLEEGMNLAYATAARAFLAGGINQVLILSDGAANLGAVAAEDILKRVDAYRRQGIQCSVYGFGMGTYDDAMLETLADKGDGRYAFIDSLDEARRVFVDELSATLNTIASDVKIQVEFNPARVKRYRQLGYENRALTKEQFRDDKVDAGEVGSGQSVTALYELELRGEGGVESGKRRAESGEGKGESGEVFSDQLSVISQRPMSAALRP